MQLRQRTLKKSVASIFQKGGIAIKRSLLTAAAALVLGLFLGTLYPPGLLPWSPRQSQAAPHVFSNYSSADGSISAINQTPDDVPSFNKKDNFTLLDSACAVVQAMKQGDWDTLSSFVHPQQGVTFTPYSTVEPEMDLNFSAQQIKKLAKDESIYVWGFTDGKGDPIQMTMLDYFNRYVFNADYSQAPQIGIDRIQMTGNALENLTDVYTDCRFVDFCYPSIDPAYGGADWQSLRLVFQDQNDRWYLVGIVHGEWTI